MQQIDVILVVCVTNARLLFCLTMFILPISLYLKGETIGRMCDESQNAKILERVEFCVWHCKCLSFLSIF